MMDYTESEFDSRFDAQFQEHYESIKNATHGSLHIAVVGKVSTGKSSLINALLQRAKDDKVAEVGSESGTSRTIEGYSMGPVKIYDTPGLGDIRAENTHETEEFLRKIDVGIFVVAGPADKDQYDNYLALKEHSTKVFFVLNKADQWDGWEPAAVQKVVAQWSAALEVDKVYLTVASGYDDDDPRPLRIEGVDELRADILSFLHARHQDLLLGRALKDKSPVVTGIIAATLLAVAGEAFIPGSEFFITSTQITAIVSLHYVYTGTMLDKRDAIAVIPAFIARSAGKTLFLWASSFLPPTGIINAAAAVIAVSITAAMLLAVAWALQTGVPLSDAQAMAAKYGEILPALKTALKGAAQGDLTNRAFWEDMIRKFLE